MFTCASQLMVFGVEIMHHRRPSSHVWWCSLHGHTSQSALTQSVTLLAKGGDAHRVSTTADPRVAGCKDATLAAGSSRGVSNVDGSGQTPQWPSPPARSSSVDALDPLTSTAWSRPELYLHHRATQVRQNRSVRRSALIDLERVHVHLWRRRSRSRVLTHDGFNLPKDSIDAYTERTGVRVAVIQGAQTHEAVVDLLDAARRQIPIADVVVGIDSLSASQASFDNGSCSATGQSRPTVSTRQLVVDDDELTPDQLH